MAAVTSQTPVITGYTPNYGAVTASDTYDFTTDASMLIVKNGGAGVCTVTVVIPGTKYGQPIADVVVSVPASGERWIGPFKPDMADETQPGHKITVTYSPITSVTAAYVKV